MRYALIDDFQQYPEILEKVAASIGFENHTQEFDKAQYYLTQAKSLLIDIFNAEREEEFGTREEGFEPEGEMLGLGSVVVIGHMVVTVLVGMAALDCLGLAGEGANDNWAGGGVLFLVGKDLLAFFATGGPSVSRELPGHWKERLADFLLLAFSCVAYSVWWQVLFDLGDLASQTVGMKVALAILLGGVFALFYLPMRLPFVLEECYRQPSRGRKKRVWTELVLGALLGFYPSFFA